MLNFSIPPKYKRLVQIQYYFYFIMFSCCFFSFSLLFLLLQFFQKTLHSINALKKYTQIIQINITKMQQQKSQQPLQQKQNGQMSQSMKNYYQILEVNPNATLRQIENSYQKLALKWHPDKHTADRKLAERKFQQISQAFDVLSDHNKRSTYDQMINKQWSLQSAYKTFDQFFGQNQMIDENQEKFFETHFPEKRKNYYKVLGVNKNATMQQITDAYRKLALKYHPKSNPNNQEARRKFIEVNQAFQTLSNRSKRSTYDDMTFGQIVPRRAHDIFEDFFENRWMDMPTQTDFFKPIFDRRGRMNDKWWSGLGRTGDWQRKPMEQLQNIKEGQSYFKEERYEKKGGKQNHTSQTVKKKIKNGQVEQQILKQNILPNGQRDVTKMLKRGDKVVDTKNWHLKRDENMPKELTNF